MPSGPGVLLFATLLTAVLTSSNVIGRSQNNLLSFEITGTLTLVKLEIVSRGSISPDRTWLKRDIEYYVKSDPTKRFGVHDFL